MPLFHTIAGVVAGIVTCTAYPSYIKAILKGYLEKKPNRATWCIWAVVSFVIMCSEYAYGNPWYAIMIPAAYFSRHNCRARIETKSETTKA